MAAQTVGQSGQAVGDGEGVAVTEELDVTLAVALGDGDKLAVPLAVALGDAEELFVFEGDTEADTVGVAQGAAQASVRQLHLSAQPVAKQ